jgi:hypothetical protein
MFQGTQPAMKMIHFVESRLAHQIRVNPRSAASKIASAASVPLRELLDSIANLMTITITSTFDDYERLNPFFE